MSRTDLDPATLTRILRRMAGDGSIEWVMEPIQASVLLDVADMLAENARLRSELESVGTAAYLYGRSDLQAENDKLRELVRDMFSFLDGADCARFPAGDVVITAAQLANFCDRLDELGIKEDQ